MNKSNYLDISLLKNQNLLAVKLSEYLSLDELENIDLSNVLVANSKRDISKPNNIIYTIEFESKTVQILDIFLLDVYPIVRFIDIRILQGDYFQMDFKIKYSKKIIMYLNIVLAKAKNYIRYKFTHENSLIKSSIIENYSTILAESISMNGLEELRFVSEYIASDENIFTNPSYKFNFSIEKITFKLSAMNNILKCEFIKNDKSNIIYFVKDKIGLSQLGLIVEKAIKIKSKK